MPDLGRLVLLVILVPWLICRLGQDPGDETEADDVERQDACGR